MNSHSTEPLTPLMQTFIDHFGEMGSRWGISRAVSQVYALLFISEYPLNADEITATLKISRSNVSMSLKELEAWQLVKLSRKPNDRREYYAALGDIWDIFKAVAAERRRREVTPTLLMLQTTLANKDQHAAQDRYAIGRLQQMYELTQVANDWFDDLQRLSPEMLMTLMKLGHKVQKLLLQKTS